MNSRRVTQHLLFMGVCISIILQASFGVINAQNDKPSLSVKTPEEIELLKAERERARAETEFYRAQAKLLTEKPTVKSMWQSLSENPTIAFSVLGASLAAMVALVSFLYNYNATIRHQRDTQFYEALKRFGDKDSAMTRSSAAGILLQMANVKTFKARPYFNNARDQLVIGLLLEDNRTGLIVCQGLITDLLAIHPYGRFDMLSYVNALLREEMAVDLAEFFTQLGATRLKDVTNEMWDKAAAMTDYSTSILKTLGKNRAIGFSDIFKSKALAFDTTPVYERPRQLYSCQQKLGATALRLSLCSHVYSYCLRKFPLIDLLSYPDSPFLAATDLRDAKLKESNLKGAILVGANLENANLSQADIRGSNLSDANLYNARMWNAKIDTATLLWGSNWWQANFFDAKNEEVDAVLLDEIERLFYLPTDRTDIHASVKLYLENKTTPRA